MVSRRLSKQPYYIYHKEHKPLYFAGLNFAITEEQNVVILLQKLIKHKSIHSRMPLIISAEDNEAWLSENVKEEAILSSRNIDLKLQYPVESTKVYNDTSY